jgi:hypothetical protein
LLSGFIAGLKHTSGSALEDLNPISSNVSARKAQNAAPELFSPYRALIMINTDPASEPNSSPSIVHHFPLHGAVK